MEISVKMASCRTTPLEETGGELFGGFAFEEISFHRWELAGLLRFDVEIKLLYISDLVFTSSMCIDLIDDLIHFHRLS